MPAFQLVVRQKVPIFPNFKDGNGNRVQRGVFPTEEGNRSVAKEFRVFCEYSLINIVIPAITRMKLIQFIGRHEDMFHPVGIFNDVTNLTVLANFRRKERP